MFSTSPAKIARALDKAGVELLYDGQDGKGAGVLYPRAGRLAAHLTRRDLPADITAPPTDLALFTKA